MINLENTFKLAMSGVKLTEDTVVPDNIQADFNKRIKDLGLSGLSNLNSDQRFEAIEGRLWTLAETVNKPIILYEEKDYQAAVDFLELFSIYAYCLSNLKSNSVLMISDDYRVLRQNNGNCDKVVLKLIRNLEEINKIVHSSPDIIPIKTTIKNMKKYVDKVFKDDLGITERRALNEKVNTAKAILSNLC